MAGLQHPRVAAVLMRGTGLRIEQVAHIQGEDLDVEANTLLIRKGKSRREKALMRTVAVPEWLAPTLEEAGGRDGVIDWLVGHSGRSTRATSYTKPSMEQMRAAVAHIPHVAGYPVTTKDE